MPFICFDLEGPLAPQDNAYELMKLFTQGGKVFEVISRYDDLLTLEGKEGYEPGDTLALILPFLLYHGIKEDDITRLAQASPLTPGAPALFGKLHAQKWQVFCISTSYQQYARHITGKLSISPEHLACTPLPLERFRSSLSQQDLARVAAVEKRILPLRPEADDAQIKEILDSFFWRELPPTPLGAALRQVKPVGGQRKVEALKSFARKHRQTLKGWVVVGDSITDFKMLHTVHRAGGVSIAFNANQYAIPYATLGLASIRLDDLWLALEVWQEGGKPALEKWCKEKEAQGGKGDRANFHWLAGRKEIEKPLAIHRKIRRLVREEAAVLG